MGFRLSGDTQELSDSGVFGSGPIRPFSGAMGGINAPVWSRQADAVLNNALFHRQESVEGNSFAEDTSAAPTRDEPSAAAEAPRDYSDRRPLPMEVTVPVLVGVLAAIVFLVMLAAFLRAHKNAAKPNPAELRSPPDTGRLGRAQKPGHGQSGKSRSQPTGRERLVARHSQ